MSLNSVSSSEFYGKINSGYGRNQKSKETSSRDTLIPSGARVPFGKSFKTDSTEQEPAAGSASVRAGCTYGKVASEMFLQNTGRITMSALMECAVRCISYEESDFSRIYAEAGYSLKSQVDITGHKVYIEQKCEDGTLQAYEVNPLLVAEDTDNPIEQMAKDAWNAARELFNDGTFTDLTAKEEEEGTLSAFERLLSEFGEYVEQRIKDGPPKIQIGGSEFSEKEWEQLLRKIDKDIDAYKEELRERIRKQQEAAAMKKAAAGTVASEAAEAIAGAAGSQSGESSESAGQTPGTEAAKAAAKTSGTEAAKAAENEESQAAAGTEAVEAAGNDAAGASETAANTIGSAPIIIGSMAVESASKTFRDKSQGPAISENEALEGLTNNQHGSSFLARLSGSKKAPYSYLADENGIIIYNGVTFVCDDKKQQICLGDMTDSKNVINIPLSKGGCLRVNRDNIGDLAKAINMFSPEDIGRILRAISQDNKLKGMEQEIENMVLQ